MEEEMLYLSRLMYYQDEFHKSKYGTKDDGENKGPPHPDYEKNQEMLKMYD